MNVRIEKYPDGKVHGGSLYASESWAGLNSESSPVFIARSTGYWILIRQNLVARAPQFHWLKPIGWFFSSLHAYGSPTGDAEDFVKEGIDFARKLGCVSFFVNDLRRPQDALLIDILEANGFEKQIWGTFLVDLSKDEATLLKNVKKEARKLVNKAKREDVTVRVAVSETDFEGYYNLLKSSRKKLGFATGPYQDILNCCKHFGPDYNVFLAEYQGKIIAGMGVMHKGGFIREIGAGRDEQYKTLYANDLLKWEIICWGHAKGYKVYDLGGCNPKPAPGSKEEGIYRFKQKWGGSFCEVYTFTKEISGWKNAIIRNMKKMIVKNI